MFERFTKKARALTVRAQELAIERDDPHIGSEHLLLAMAEPGSGVAADVLAPVGITGAAVSAALADQARRPAVVTDEDVDVLRDLGIDAEAILEQARRDVDAGPTPEQVADMVRRIVLSEGPPEQNSLLAAAASRLRGRRDQASPTVRRGAVRPFTKSAKKVLENSLREALQLGDNYISTEHLVLGLLRTDCLALEVLTELGTDLEDVRTRAKQSRPGAA